MLDLLTWLWDAVIIVGGCLFLALVFGYPIVQYIRYLLSEK